MNRAELNTSIDIIYDDARPDDSLIPSMAGAKLKEVADYVDQEASKKVDKTSGERLMSALEITKIAAQSGKNTGDQDLSVFYTKTQVDAKITSVYRFRDNVANYNALPSTGLVIGDVYNLTDTGANWAWTGTVWDNLGTTIDVSGKEDVSNKSTDGSLAGNSDKNYPSEKAVKTYVDDKLVGTPKTYGTISATTDFPYPVSTFDITKVNATMALSRIVLKNSTPAIGTTYRVVNNSKYTILVKASQLTDQVFYVTGLMDNKTTEVPIEVNGQYDFTYIGTDWLVNAVNDLQLQPLEYSAQLYQAGTVDQPFPQFPQINTLSQQYGGGTSYVSVSFGRNGVGDYWVRVNRGGGITFDPNKLVIMFGDSTCRIYERSEGGSTGVNYTQFKFKSYTPAGVVSDDVLLGNNGTFINIKYYR